MGDGSLSQDEIDALLQGADDMLTPAAPTSGMDMGAGNAVQGDMNSVIQTLSSVLPTVASSLVGFLSGKNITISNPVVESKSVDQIRGELSGQFVQIMMDYSGVATGKNLIVFSGSDAGSIASLMMGDETSVPPVELTEAQLSTIQEFTNLFLSSMATQIANKFGGGISTTPAVISMVNTPAEFQLPIGNLTKITYDVVIDGILNSKFYHIMDYSLISAFSTGGGASAQQPVQQQMQSQGGSVGINPVRFPQLDEGIAGVTGNINLLLDVPMTLTVELGRTTKLVQDILGLGEGSIIELDKLAGEPVDLLVNGKLIAKGEVVVIDENFGVRVTDIVSPAERLIGVQ